MGIFYRAMGSVAAVNRVLGTVRFYSIPANWLALAVLAGVFADGVWRMDEMTPGALFGDGRGAAIARASLALCGLLLFATCIIRRNLIFRRTAAWTPAAAAAAGEPGADATVNLRASGRFRRSSGDSLLLRDFRVAWDVSDTGVISLSTHVIEVGGMPDMIGIPSDRTGSWSLTIPRKALLGDMEEGLVYYGLTARPALRFRLARKPDPVVLSLGRTSELLAFRRNLDAVLAESARQSAAFAEKLDAIARASGTEPAPAGAGPEKRAAAGNPAEPGVAWDNLIDFSK